MSAAPILDRRTLNRTLLMRQHLLERCDLGPTELLEHLVGMQGQEPLDPYVALWARSRDYDPAELAELMRRRGAVRGALMRATLHMVTARDYLTLRLTLRPVLERMFQTGSPFGRPLRGIDLDRLLEQGRGLLGEAPRTRAELSRLLAEDWAGWDATALGYAVVYLLPLVQVTPRGVWGESKQATWSLAEEWIGEELAREPSNEEMIRRYLGAFGPASVMDIQAWCGLTRLGEVVEPMRPELRTFRDEAGVELLDLADAPLAEPDLHAPVRFLPCYDNVILGHADRSRIVPKRSDGAPLFEGFSGNLGSLLVDGFFRGLWRREVDGGNAILRIEVTRPLSKRDGAAVAAEGRRLLDLIAAEYAEREVRIA